MSTKHWKEGQSLNFRLSPNSEMLAESAFIVVSQDCPNRTTIPKELRPYASFKYDSSYVVEFFSHYFKKFGKCIDGTSLITALLSDNLTITFSDNQSTLEADSINHDDIHFDNLIAVMEVVFEYISQYSDKSDSPRIAKGFELATKIAAINPFTYDLACKSIISDKLKNAYSSKSPTKVKV